MKEVIVVTGSKGSGKSMTVAYFARPSQFHKMVIVDTEDSMSDIVKKADEMEKPFGKFVRMYERLKFDEDLLSIIASGKKLPWAGSQGKALVDYYLYFIKKMDEVLVKDKYEYLVIDTIEPIEAGLAMWAEVNRELSGWSGARDHGKLEVQAIRPLYDAMLESFAQRGIKHILLTSHLKQPWLNDKPIPGKVEPGGRLALLSRLSTMMLWLVPDVGNANGAPAAIVLKARKAQVEIDTEKDEWVIRKPLPQRIPSFSWTEVRRYEKEGCDRKNPQAGETITEAERDMISEMLNDAQMKLMVLGAEEEVEKLKANQMPFMGTVESGDNGVDPELVAKVLGLKAEGFNASQIATQLGVSLPTVIKALKE